MALLNRFSRLNDRGETGVFTFIVTKSVTRDLHRDATTKDFCFGYHRWAVSFQRPNERVLGVHLLLRNPSPSTSCVVDFTLTLLNRHHFSENEVYQKCQAKFTITNPMQGVARWIQVSDLVERHFSNETGEFLFELALSNMTTIFECDIQLSPSLLGQYKTMLRGGQNPTPPTGSRASNASSNRSSIASGAGSDLIQLETNYFTFGAFDWSLTIVPLVVSNGDDQQLEPVCRVYLNRLNGFDCLCRVKYRVILGHHNQSCGGNQQPPACEHADSRVLDQISDAEGRIRGHQFRHTNLLKLISLRSGPSQASSSSQQQHPSSSSSSSSSTAATVCPAQPSSSSLANNISGGNNSISQSHPTAASSSLDLRVHIEMFCANTVSEARVPLQRRPNEAQVSNCSDRNKQAWCVESATEEASGSEGNVRLKLFFVDLASVPRNHIRYISWIAYVVRRDSKSGLAKESLPVRNSPHSNYYLQDGADLGTIMDTDIPLKELNANYLDGQQQLMVHIEWVDSLLLFSHLYTNYDALATIQRHQIGQELQGLQLEFDELERKYVQCKRSLSQLTSVGQQQQQQQQQPRELTPPPAPQAASVASSSQAAESAELNRQPAAAATKTPARQAGAYWQQPTAAAHEQPKNAAAMSLDERLRFSSSTPPASRRRLPQQPVGGGQHQQQQQLHRASLEQQSLQDAQATIATFNHHHHQRQELVSRRSSAQVVAHLSQQAYHETAASQQQEQPLAVARYPNLNLAGLVNLASEPLARRSGSAPGHQRAAFGGSILGTDQSDEHHQPFGRLPSAPPPASQAALGLEELELALPASLATSLVASGDQEEAADEPVDGEEDAAYEMLAAAKRAGHLRGLLQVAPPPLAGPPPPVPSAPMLAAFQQHQLHQLHQRRQQQQQPHHQQQQQQPQLYQQYSNRL